MTYTAAAAFNAAWREQSASSAMPERALRFVRNSFVLSLGATAFVGVAAVAVTFTAAWMAGGAMQPHVRLPSGPASLALVPYTQSAKAVGGQGSALPSASQWADAFIDRTRPILPAEKARPAIAQPSPAPSPASRAHAPAVPLPRPLPARLAQTRAEIEPPQAVAIAEVPANAAAAVPVQKPESPSKLEAMAKIDPKPEVRDDTKAPPKPAPVATIPVAPPSTLPDSVSRTAVYDITGSVVHMPDGSKLEAHSGLGERMDDPRHIKVRMRGPTPPNVYVLTERERLFHGVRAIRLNPVYDDRMFGRDGMLAHSYMLGPNGQSNGCVSFKDYKKFLTAFLDGKVDKLVVVADLKNQSWKSAALQADGIPASPRRYAGGYSRPTIMPPAGNREAEPRYTAALGFAAERGAGTW